MAEPPSHPDSPAAAGRSRPRSSSTPRWVKVLGIIAIILVVLIVIAMLTGIGGSHGPSRHLRSGSTPSLASPAGNLILSVWGDRG